MEQIPCGSLVLQLTISINFLLVAKHLSNIHSVFSVSHRGHSRPLFSKF